MGMEWELTTIMRLQPVDRPESHDDLFSPEFE